MKSKITAVIHLELEPVAFVWSDEKPEGAMAYLRGNWGCVLLRLAAAAKGRTAVASLKTFGCFGGGVSLGFGEQYTRTLPAARYAFAGSYPKEIGHFAGRFLNQVSNSQGERATGTVAVERI